MCLLDLFGLLWEVAFECLLPVLLGLVMTGTRNLEGKTNSLEVIPPTLRMDLSLGLLTHPERDFLACP